MCCARCQLNVSVVGISKFTLQILSQSMRFHYYILLFFSDLAQFNNFQKKKKSFPMATSHALQMNGPGSGSNKFFHISIYYLNPKISLLK